MTTLIATLTARADDPMPVCNEADAGRWGDRYVSRWGHGFYLNDGVYTCDYCGGTRADVEPRHALEESGLYSHAVRDEQHWGLFSWSPIYQRAYGQYGRRMSVADAAEVARSHGQTWGAMVVEGPGLVASDSECAEFVWTLDLYTTLGY